MKLIKRVWELILALFSSKVKKFESQNIGALIEVAKRRKNQEAKKIKERLVKIVELQSSLNEQIRQTTENYNKMHAMAVNALAENKEDIAAEAALRAEDLKMFLDELTVQATELQTAYDTLHANAVTIATDYDAKISRLEIAAARMSVKQSIAEVCEVSGDANGTDSLNEEIKNIMELISSNTNTATAVIKVNTDLGLKCPAKNATEVQAARQAALERLRTEVSGGADNTSSDN